MPSVGNVVVMAKVAAYQRQPWFCALIDRLVAESIDYLVAKADAGSRNDATAAEARCDMPTIHMLLVSTTSCYEFNLAQANYCQWQ